MAPTIRDGALALVDTSEHQVSSDGVYVLQLDGHLIAKRLQPDFAGGVFIRSDNPAYREQHLPADLAANLTVVGRAIWAGGKL
jgi:phage repressor protein C with HTH and peptisase S24 domain